MFDCKEIWPWNISKTWSWKKGSVPVAIFHCQTWSLTTKDCLTCFDHGRWCLTMITWLTRKQGGSTVIEGPLYSQCSCKCWTFTAIPVKSHKTFKLGSRRMCKLKAQFQPPGVKSESDYSETFTNGQVESLCLRNRCQWSKNELNLNPWSRRSVCD